MKKMYKAFIHGSTSAFAMAVVLRGVVACAEATDGVALAPWDRMPMSLGGLDGTDAESPAPKPGESLAANIMQDASVPVTASNTPGPSTSLVLLNEVSPSAEWVEIVNAGTVAVDLSGYRVADRSADGGAPKLDDSAVFPEGSWLSPRAYAVVQGGGVASSAKACPDGGQSYCVNAAFGISNSKGETLYLVNPKGDVVDSVEYPPKAVATNETWGRLPSGAGAESRRFGKTAPTPGAANVSR